jgi:putative ABC transport system permease protein
MTCRPRNPILQGIARHRAIAVLLSLQVVLAFAIASNAMFMLVRSTQLMRQPSGMDEDAVLLVDAPRSREPVNAADRDATLAALAALPGVHGAIAVDALPFGYELSDSLHRSDQADGGEGIQASIFGATPGALRTLGLRLEAGRDFDAGEYVDGAEGAGLDQAPAAIVSHALAMQLFGTAGVLGKTIRTDAGHPLRIVGVIEHLMRAQPLAAAEHGTEHAVLVPVAPRTDFMAYALRGEPGDMQRIAGEAGQVLARNGDTPGPDAVRTLAQAREQYFRHELDDTRLLAGAMLVLLMVTAIGIGGLASFWVRKRNRASGIRRALGATRGAIIRHFLVENMLVVAAGNGAGVLAALALNRLLVSQFEFARLPPAYLAVGAIVLWITGLVAILPPALRAATVMPATALRNP